MRIFLLLLLLPIVSGCVCGAGHGVVFCRFLVDEKLNTLEIHTPDGAWIKLGALDSSVSPVTSAVVQAVVAGAVRALVPVP